MGCRSGMGAYEAGRGKKHRYTHYKKLDYTTAHRVPSATASTSATRRISMDMTKTIN